MFDKFHVSIVGPGAWGRQNKESAKVQNYNKPSNRFRRKEEMCEKSKT